MKSNPDAYTMLVTLFDTQRLAVLGTMLPDRPYTSLVAFLASDDLRRIIFATTRATTKYRNLSRNPNVSVLIDSRSHTVEDFATGVAVTVMGTAAEITGAILEPTRERFIRKHPHLETFVTSPSTAVCAVEVEKYIVVTRFQQVVEMDVKTWSSSNHSRK